MLTLNLVKYHLRLEGSDEDELLQHYWDAAVSAFETLTNRTLIPEGQPLPDPIGNALVSTKSIEQGILLLIGHWYENREAVLSAGAAIELPMTTKALWMPHRWNNI